MLSRCAHMEVHPRDSRITLDEINHVYSVDGSSFMYRSVTEIIGDYCGPFIADDVLLRWYPAWQECPSRKPEYYNKLREDVKAEWQAERQKGIALHSAMQAYFHGDQLQLRQDRRVLQQAKVFLRLPVAPKSSDKVCAERLVFDEDLRLAGTIDLLVQHEDGSVSIFDWKRSKNPLESTSQHDIQRLEELAKTAHGKARLQVNMYAHILESKYGITVRDMFVVRFHDNSSAPEVVQMRKSPAQIEQILADRREHLEYQVRLLMWHISGEFGKGSVSEATDEHGIKFATLHCGSDILNSGKQWGLDVNFCNQAVELTKANVQSMKLIGCAHKGEKVVDAIGDSLLPWLPDVKSIRYPTSLEVPKAVLAKTDTMWNPKQPRLLDVLCECDCLRAEAIVKQRRKQRRAAPY